jgi:FkbM family methyltransferase
VGSFQIDDGRVTTLDLGGFNELRFCRHGPMLFNKNDIYVGGSLRKYGEFSHGEWELFEKIVTPGMTVIEVGANIGAHTIPLAKRAARVIAFEPQRLCFQLLCANVALNQLDNVVAYPYACGAQDGLVPMPMYDPRQPFNFGGVPAGWSDDVPEKVQAEKVRMLAIDNLPRGSGRFAGAHFVKLDVEGWECEVLTGARELIKQYRPILYVENDRRERSQELVLTLRSMDYDLYWHTPYLFNPLNHARVRENIFPNVASINMLCMPAGTRPPMEMRPVLAHDEIAKEMAA